MRRRRGSQRRKREGNLPRAQEFGANLSFAAAAASAIALAPLVGAFAARGIRDAASGSVHALAPALLARPRLRPDGRRPPARACSRALRKAEASSSPAYRSKPNACSRSRASSACFRERRRRTRARALVAFAVASAAIWPSLHDVLLAVSAAASATSIAQIAWRGSMRAIFAAVAIGLLFAFAEYALARRAWLRKLRMSLAELRRELKESDGDPLARSRRRSMHRIADSRSACERQRRILRRRQSDACGGRA